MDNELANAGSLGVIKGSNRTSETKSANNPSEPFLKLPELVKKFSRTFDSEKSWRGQKRIWQQFYDGKQLTSDEMTELDSRAQPSVVINKIAPRIDLIVGLNASNRFRLKAYPRNISDEDISTSDAISKALFYIEQTNNQKFKESDVFEDGCLTGRGWFEVTSQFDEDFDLDILVKNRSSDDILVDPASQEYDLKDAKYIFDSVFVHRDDMLGMFPSFEKEILAASAGDITYRISKTYSGDDYQMARDDLKNLFCDRNNGRVRVTKYWFRTRELRKFFITDLGVERLDRGISNKDFNKAKAEIKKVTGKDPTVIEKQVDVVRVQTFISNTILENKEPEFLGGKFPYIPFLVKRERDTGMPYGLVRPMMDPQKEINKRRSKGLHALNTERVVYEEGAVENEDTLKKEMARPDGVIKKNRGFAIDIQSNREMTQSQLTFYEAANSELDQVTGVPPDLMGQVTNARSANAIQTRQRSGLAILNRVFENWKRTRILLEEMKLVFLQEFWTQEKAIRVMDDQGIVDVLPLNKVYQDAAGNEMKLNDVRSGKYDIIVDEADEAINEQDDLFKEMAKLAQVGQIPPDIPFEIAPIPKGLRDRLLKRLKESVDQKQATEVQVANAQAAQAQAEAMGAENAPPL